MVTRKSDGGDSMLPELQEAYPWLRRKLWYWTLRSEMEFSDLLSLALVKIVEAERTYDPSREASLKTWQAFKVDGAIQSEIKYWKRKNIIMNRYRAGLERGNIVLSDVYFKDVLQRENLVEKFEKLPEYVQDRVLLWATGHGPKEIGETVGKTLETVINSFTKYLPHYRDVQNEECRNGHLYGRYNVVPSSGPKKCLACHQYNYQRYNERKKEAV